MQCHHRPCSLLTLGRTTRSPAAGIAPLCDVTAATRTTRTDRLCPVIPTFQAMQEEARRGQLRVPAWLPRNPLARRGSCGGVPQVHHDWLSARAGSCTLAARAMFTAAQSCTCSRLEATHETRAGPSRTSRCKARPRPCYSPVMQSSGKGRSWRARRCIPDARFAIRAHAGTHTMCCDHSAWRRGRQQQIPDSPSLRSSAALCAWVPALALVPGSCTTWCTSFGFCEVRTRRHKVSTRPQCQ